MVSGSYRYNKDTWYSCKHYSIFDWFLEFILIGKMQSVIHEKGDVKQHIRITSNVRILHTARIGSRFMFQKNRPSQVEKSEHWLILDRDKGIFYKLIFIFNKF